MMLTNWMTLIVYLVLAWLTTERALRAVLAMTWLDWHDDQNKVIEVAGLGLAATIVWMAIVYTVLDPRTDPSKQAWDLTSGIIGLAATFAIHRWVDKKRAKG
jgi:hypothetical protein